MPAVAEVEAIRRHIEEFVRIASASDTVVASAADDAVADVPVSLIAAARPARRHGEPVRITGPGFDVLAVLDARTGDPRSWWAAVGSLMPSPGVTVVPGMPAGLLAVAREHGDKLAVSTSAPFRASPVLAVVQAARRAGWASARSRRPAGLVLAGGAASLRLAGRRWKGARAGVAAAACAVAVMVTVIVAHHAANPGGAAATAASQPDRSSGVSHQPLAGGRGSGTRRGHQHSPVTGPASRRQHSSRLVRPRPAEPVPSVTRPDPSPLPPSAHSPTPQPSPRRSPGHPSPQPTPSSPGTMCIPLPGGSLCL